MHDCGVLTLIFITTALDPAWFVVKRTIDLIGER